MYHALQLDRMRVQEQELRRRIERRPQWSPDGGDGAESTTARRRWWPRPRRQIRLATSSSGAC